MNLFQYNPQNYKGTQVDLPLDFIYKQLETKQKEFDLQNAAVDKATENFLKIDPGMLTKDAYDRVMKQYLPQLEKIRDTLVNTGNVSMAAPELSRFTTNLAADAQVKKIMQDSQATKLYQQGLLEGRYVDMDFANLHDAEGNLRPQLREDEAFNPMIYAPAKYNDPVDLLKEDVQKFKADLDELPPTEWRDKDGRLITDTVSIEQLKKERIANYVRGRQPSIINSPQYKAWVNRSTDWGTKPMTSDIYEERVVNPLLNFAYRQIKRDREVTNPVAAATNTNPGKTTNPPSDPENKAKNNLLYSQSVQGYAEALRNFDDTKSLADPSEIFEEIDNINGKQASAFKIITQLTKLPSAITGNNFNNVDNYYKKYYETNPEGRLVKKKFDKAINPAAEVTPELEEAFNLYNNISPFRSGLQNIWTTISEDINMKDFRPEVIKKAKAKAQIRAFNSVPSSSDGAPFVKDGNYDVKDIYQNALNYLKSEPSGKFAGVAQSYISKYEEGIIDPKTYNEVFDAEIRSILKDEPEGKVYKAFENLKNKLSNIEVTTLSENKALEESLIPGLLLNRSNVRDLSTNLNVWSKNGGEDFLASVPRDENGNIKYDNISTGFGLDPENGLIGVVSFNGKFYEFDIDNNNYDQFITEGSPEVKTKIRFYDELHKSMKNTANTAGKFTIGNVQFNVKTEAKKLGTDSPEFSYTYNFGEGEHKTTNLGEMYTTATRIASDNMNKADAKLQLKYIEIQKWRDTEFNKIKTWQQREALDTEFSKRIKEATDNWQKENSNLVIVGKDVGKQKPQTKDPLNLGL
jgi:hypothetical protein